MSVTYLDWAASTPLRPEAAEAMTSAASSYGNPSGVHGPAQESRRIVDNARQVFADALGAHPSEIVFTGSGTEADNIAVFGATRPGQVPLCSAIEHPAVLRPVEALGGRVVGVDARGVIALDELVASLDPDVSVVSVMLSNNESGVIQPITDVVAAVREHAPSAVVHCDAIQGFPWIDTTAALADVDLVSLSAHKFGGPKGLGVLKASREVKLQPQTIGGGQEFGLRSGTQNVIGIAGAAAAATAMLGERDEQIERVGQLRDRLAAGIAAAVPEVQESGVGADGDRSHKVASSCHLLLPGIESEAVLFLLGREGIAASAASSCASGAQHPSHVLEAMGYSSAEAAGALRLTLGYGSTDADIDHALRVIPDVLAGLLVRAS